MDSIVKFLEKGQPYFDKISKNIYLQAVKDGFLANMPIVLSSSLFLLVSTLPGIVGIALPQPVLDFCNKIYTYSMGVVGIMVAGTTAHALTVSMNHRMPAGKAINATSTMVAAMCGMLLLAVTNSTVEIDGAGTSVFDTGFMGTKGLLSSFVSAFITVNVYRFCIARDITIKLPKEVPGSISQSFRDIFAFSFSILICAFIDLAVRTWLAVPFAAMLSTLISPLFTAADTYPGMAVVFGSISLFQFMGIHGASVVKPALNAALFGNIELNLQAFQAGMHPALAFTEDFGNFIAGLGGSGCTFIVPIILIFLMRSKQLKAVGKASIIPCIFCVNEPLLFGLPIILNPYMFIPFLIAPIVNAWIGKFFIDVLGMNAAMYALPWALPGPIGTFIDSNFQPISLLLVVILLAVDFVIYYPFCKAYDNTLCKQEAEALAAETVGGAIPQVSASPEATAAEPAAIASAAAERVKGLKVLVLCAGAGTSALLANALKEGAEQLGVELASTAGAYGSHYAIMDQYDVIVLAPQVRTYYDEMKAETDKLGIKLLSPRGKEYIDLTGNPTGAVKWLLDQME